MSAYRMARLRYATDPETGERGPVEWVPWGESFPTFRAAALWFVRAMEPDLLAATDEFAMRHYAVYRRNKWARVVKVETKC